MVVDGMVGGDGKSNVGITTAEELKFHDLSFVVLSSAES
jgi:hypothetical protein